jgi:GNAT superfamily N-acetyltransferase
VRISVREIEDSGRLCEWLAVRNELEPDEPLLFDQLLARRAAEPERHELLATAAGEIVGVGTIGAKGSPPDLAYGYIGVRHAWRRAGVESVLLAELRSVARALGRSQIELWANEDHPSLVSLLGREGFREVMRESGLALDIADAHPVPADIPDGITVLPLSSRADLADGAYDLAAQTWTDIPGETGIEEREAWLRLHVRNAAGGAAVALGAGEVIGFAGLRRLAEGGLYEHGLLAVRRDHPRRGIARAMKVAQLRWLIEQGARRVVTWNAEENDAARTLNLSLGYRPLSSSIGFHGPT